jgi:hypothetical protein
LTNDDQIIRRTVVLDEPEPAAELRCLLDVRGWKDRNGHWHGSPFSRNLEPVTRRRPIS